MRQTSSQWQHASESKHESKHEKQDHPAEGGEEGDKRASSEQDRRTFRFSAVSIHANKLINLQYRVACSRWILAGNRVHM